MNDPNAMRTEITITISGVTAERLRIIAGQREETIEELTATVLDAGQAAIGWDPKAECPTFDAFLKSCGFEPVAGVEERLTVGDVAVENARSLAAEGV